MSLTGPATNAAGRPVPGANRCPILIRTQATAVATRALGPMLPSDAPSHELTDFTRRMWTSAAAAMPLIVLTMGPMVGLPERDGIGHQTASGTEVTLDETADGLTLDRTVPGAQSGQLTDRYNRLDEAWSLSGIWNGQSASLPRSGLLASPAALR